MSSWRSRVPYLGYRVGATAARLLPSRVAVGVAMALGRAVARRGSARRATIARHLRRVHGDHLSGPALDREVRRSFESYARYWIESFRLPALSRDQIEAGMAVQGLEHLDVALAAGNGAIVALPHLGGWDFCGAWLALQGYRITVVVEPLEPPELFEWFAEFRRSIGLTIVPLGPAAGTAVLRALKAGDAVGLLSDRDVGGGGVEVEFFGERTTLPGGPATLALRTGAPILPTAAYFEGSSGHLGVIMPPVPVARSGEGLRADVARVTQDLARHLEVLIRRAPDQWHLFQPNWPSDPGYGG